jgi:hypothetical protein
MPEDDLSSESLPVSPAETSATAPLPAENEHDPEIQPAAKNSVVEKIRRAGATVFSAAGIQFRAGRGRPRKDGKPNASARPLDDAGGGAAGFGAPVVERSLAGDPPAAPASESVAGSEALPNFDAEINNLLRRCISGGAKGVTEGCNAITRTLAASAGIDAGFTEKTLAHAKPEQDALDNFAASVDLCLEKHSPKVKEGGEWYCLTLSAGRILAPYALVWWEFKKEIARKNKSENP